MESRLRIMIVDDDPDLVDMLQTALEEDYEITSAVNGLDALTRAVDYEPDLFIIDIMMPVMSGWELIDQLRLDPVHEKTPIIVLTAKDARSDVKKGYEIGANLYLTKPLSIERLERNIEVFIKRDGLAPRPKKMTMGEIRRLEAQDLRGVGAPSEEPRRTITPPPEPPPPPPPPPRSTPVEGVEAEDERKMDPFLRGDHLYKEPTAERRAKAFPETDARGRGPEPLAAAPATRMVRLLFADDDPDMLAMAREMLGDDYELIEAHDGLEAIQKASKYKPDLFIVDGMMPRMSGYQLCGVLHTSEEFKEAPIIFMSGKASPKDQQYVKSLRVSRFLAKPFSPGQLTEAVETIVGDPNFTVRLNCPPWQAVMRQEREDIYRERKRHQKEEGLEGSRRTINRFLEDEI